jgi:4-amino-4-deoxy-L-arabinose transferase-like glycosyltransferase
MLAHLWQKLYPHWPLVAAAMIALALVLTNLGKDHFWADEGDTAVLAANIVKTGLPKAWDGITFIDSDKGARLNHALVMVSSPWLQYYVAAATFFMFGENTFAARLPFALAGWLTVIFAYRLVLRTTSSRTAAFCAASILICSVQFLLYCRQCRYYALSMLLTALLIEIFGQLKSPRQCVFFAIAAILLFHTHPIGFVPVIALGILTLVHPKFHDQRRWFWIATPVVALFTLPWLVLARTGYAESMGGVQSVSQFFGRVLQFLIECASVTPLLGVLILVAIYFVQTFRRPQKRTGSGPSRAARAVSESGIGLLVFIFVTLLLYAFAVAATQSADSLWRIGIRYTTPVIPLIAIASGILIAGISQSRTSLSIVILLTFVFTKFAQLTPWIFWGKSVTSFDGKEVIAAHLPTNNVERYLNTRQQLIFLRDLFEDNPGIVAQASRFLQENAKPGDALITNYEWEPLYFHTHLPQALKILPDYPVYQVAKDNGLPQYVFDVDRVRWIVWRPVWEGYQGYSAADVAQQIEARGGRIERVAVLPETLWENRENIHFRRFGGGVYLFHEPGSLPHAAVLRVDWPGN